MQSHTKQERMFKQPNVKLNLVADRILITMSNFFNNQPMETREKIRTHQLQPRELFIVFMCLHNAFSYHPILFISATCMINNAIMQ